MYLIRKQRRGQAAMEFLMTYGWAILAAIIAIGVLAYFGVFSADGLAGSSAFVSQPFYVEAWNVQEDLAFTTSGVALELVNTGGQTFTVTQVEIDSPTGGMCQTFPGDVPTPAGTPVVFEVFCIPVLQEGDGFRGDITVRYQKPGSNLILESKGSIRDTVIP